MKIRGHDASVFTPREFKASRIEAWVGSTSVDNQFIALSQLEMPVLRAYVERIAAFGALQAGWNQGIGSPVTDAARSQALRILGDALHVSSILADASPLESGGIMLEWQIQDRNLIVEIMPNGAAEFLLSLGDDLAQEGPVKFIGPYIKKLSEALLVMAQ